MGEATGNAKAIRHGRSEHPGEATCFRDRDQLDAAVHRWLQDALRPGDMILIGGATPLSRFIQRRLRSDFTHAALVIGDGSIAESYDYRLSMLESDDGVTETSLEDFHRRHAKVSAVSILRPDGLDVDAVLEQIELYSERHIPYPTAGMVVLALAVATARLAGRQQEGSLRERLLRRLVVSQVKLAADGDAYMHCAEYVTRMYWAGGLALRFKQLTLSHDFPHWDNHPTEQIKPENRRHQARQAGTGPARTGGPTHSTAATAIIARSAPFALFDLCRALTHRRKKTTSIDLADVVFPPDLASATPLVEVGRINVDQTRLTIRSYYGALPWSNK